MTKRDDGGAARDDRKLAKQIVDGILDAVERTGRITKKDGLTLSCIVNWESGKTESVHERLVDWTQKMISARAQPGQGERGE